jgi:glycosyltransferase involved in cell wall biosynthesis
MKVALVAPPYHSQEVGVGRTVRELARAVSRAGGEAEVLAHLPEAVRAAAAEEGIVVRQLRAPLGSGYAASHGIWSHLRRHGDAYDLVHVHGYLPLPAVLGARGLFGRLVFSPGGDGLPRRRIGQLTRNPYGQLGRTALTAADLIVCSSHSEAAEISRLFPLIASRVSVVSNGIDTEAITAARPFASDRRVIVSVGRADGSGRADRAISALPALGSGYELVMLRCGSARRRLQASADDLLVTDQVRIMGSVSDATLHRWLRTASVVLVLGERDTGGLTLMEAACAGVPVIASDTPTHREVVRLIDDAALRLLSGRASPLVIADEITRVAEMRMSPLSTLAVPSLKHAAEEMVALYSAVLDNRLTGDLGTTAGAGLTAADAEKPDDLRSLGEGR